jgi:signal transduction histidine kinase/CHASE2 domain-containing sensor protein
MTLGHEPRDRIVHRPQGNWRQTLGWAVVLWVVVVALSLVPVVREFQVRLTDTFFRLAPLPKQRSPVVLVLIDEESLRTYGRWPWSRTLLAELVNNLTEAGVSVIGLDILLSEPQSPEADRALSESLQASHRVVIVDKIGNFPDGPHWIEPLPEFTRSASVGHAQAVLDGDSICRRFPPQELTLEGLRWAFAIELAGSTDASQPSKFLTSHELPESQDTLRVSMAAPVLIRIPFRRDGFQTISAQTILNRTAVGPVRGRPVIVGFGLVEIGDRLSTPLSSGIPTPGAEIHAQILDSILTGRALHEAPLMYSALLLLLSCVLAIRIFQCLEGWKGFAWLIALAAGLYGGTFLAFVVASTMLPVGAFALTVIFGPLLVYTADFVAVERSVTEQLLGLRSFLGRHEKEQATRKLGGLPWKLQVLQDLHSELGALYELHRALLESAQDLVAIFDEEGDLLLKNSLFATVASSEPEPFTLEKLRARLLPQEGAELFHAGSTWEGEAHWRDELYSLRLVPLPPTQISPGGGTILTMTSLRTREERDRARAEALGFITHELRTPLTAIQGFAELMLHYPNSPSCAAAPATIARESKRLLALINTYLDLLRVDAGAKPLQTTVIDSDDLVKQVFSILEPLAAENGMRLILRRGAAMVAILGDESLISGAILNLVGNATKYGAPGTDIVVSCHRDDGEVVIAVENQGVAISADDIPHIFDRYYRAPEAERTVTGWGLGLAFVKRIAEKHGGRIAVQSRSTGTTFEIRLPDATTAVAEEKVV